MLQCANLGGRGVRQRAAALLKLSFNVFDWRLPSQGIQRGIPPDSIWVLGSCQRGAKDMATKKTTKKPAAKSKKTTAKQSPKAKVAKRSTKKATARKPAKKAKKAAR